MGVDAYVFAVLFRSLRAWFIFIERSDDKAMPEQGAAWRKQRALRRLAMAEVRQKTTRGLLGTSSGCIPLSRICEQVARHSAWRVERAAIVTRPPEVTVEESPGCRGGQVRRVLFPTSLACCRPDGVFRCELVQQPLGSWGDILNSNSVYQ
jgi:hypothetical protein